MAATKFVLVKTVCVTCKERRCGKAFTAALAKLIENKGKATCPYCTGISHFRPAEYLTAAPNLDCN